MMKLTLPSKSQKISKKVTEMATFRFVSTQKLDLSMYNLSKEDKTPFNTNFAVAGHESCLFILAIGFPWYIL